MTEDVVPVALLMAAAAVWLLPGWVVGRSGRAARVIRPSLRRMLVPAAGAAAALTLAGAPWWLTLPAAFAGGYLGTRMARRDRPLTVDQLRALAATVDVFAACLDAGLPTAPALSACLTDRQAPCAGHRALARAAALLMLGVPPADAWRPAGSVPQLADLAAAAGRSATAGLTLADAARETSTALRAACRTAVADRAARAGVAITAPLAVCFLPAFLCLGLAPTVIGMVASIHLW